MASLAVSTETEPVILSSGDSRDDIGTVAYLRLKNAKLINKYNALLKETGQDWVPPINTFYNVPFSSKRAMRMFYGLSLPDTMEVAAHRLRDELLFREEGCHVAETQEEVQARQAVRGQIAQMEPYLVQTGVWLSVGHIKYQAQTLEAEVRGCFESLQAQLSQVNAELTAVAHINLYLSSMSLFPAVNAIYNTFFGPSPPTRACVSALLPKGQNILMDVIVHLPPFSASSTTSSRTALHVRSISFWAPANIGPYSQSVHVGGRLFIAGQIGLMAPTLRLPDPPEFSFECGLSTQHVRRIVAAMQEGTGGGFKGFMESCICWISGPKATFTAKRDNARIAWKVWMGSKAELVPMIIVQVPELPRGAMVEWQITWRTGRREAFQNGDEDSDDDENTELKPSYTQSREEGIHSQRISIGNSVFDSVTVTSDASTMDKLAISSKGNPFSLRAFYTGEPEPAQRLVEAVYASDARYTPVNVLNLATLHLDSVAVTLAAFSQV